ncbi:MAG TPA: hypothetical protein VHB01_04355 [Nitrosospira sp.]|jgi:hypothetical protein|nr:hypothetical protein [Nitrosospira sp.]
MKYEPKLNSRAIRSIIGVFFLGLGIAGTVHAQIKTPGQGDSMQRPADSMQPPVIPGKPFAKGTTRGEEAERKNRFDRNQEEANRGHKLDSNSGYGGGQGGSSSGSSGTGY